MNKKVILIIVFIVMCFALSAYGIISNLSDNKVKSKKKQSVEVETTEPTSIVGYTSIDEKKVDEELINKLNESIIIPDGGFSLYFSKDAEINTIDDEALISFALSKYALENKLNESIEKDFENNFKDDSKNFVKRDVVEKEITKIFNIRKNMLLEDESEYQILNYIAKYNAEKNIFNFPINPTNEVLNIETSSFEYFVDNNTLYIDNKVLACDYDSGVVCYNITSKDKGPVIASQKTKKTNSKTIIDSKIMKDDTVDFVYIFEKYDKKIDTYRVGFKLGTDGNYYWQISTIL